VFRTPNKGARMLAVPAPVRDIAAMSTYVMREKLFSIGDDSWIETAEGDRVIKVNGKALRLRQTLILEDRSGRELCKVQERKLSVRDTMKIKRDHGPDAVVRKRVIGIRHRFHVEVDGGDDLEVRGNIVDHEYQFRRHRDKVAEVSKRWMRVRDTYGIEIEPGEDETLILAATVCLDRLAHD
jgi:uncharacterized protein YxjI